MKTKINLTVLALTFASLIIPTNVSDRINDLTHHDHLSIACLHPELGLESLLALIFVTTLLCNYFFNFKMKRCWNCLPLSRV